MPAGELDRSNREQRLKVGGTESQRIGEITLVLYWEVWRSDEEIREEATPRARFVIERGHISGRLTSKHAYDSFEEATKAFDMFEREYAIEAAKKAFGLDRQDTVKIRRPPTF